MTTHVTNIPAEEQLVPVFTAKIGDTVTQACDARALHTYLQNGKQFADWIKQRIEKYGFVANQDYIQVIDSSASPKSETSKSNSYGIGKIDYHLTLDMAKELAMVENNAKGREVRRYFIRMEKLALAATITPKLNPGQHFADTILPDFTPAIAARAWADMAQAQADKARAWADEYERRVATEAQSPASSQPPSKTQPLLPPREAAFIQAWWDCLGTQSVTASDLYRTVTAKQCQILNDASGALLGDVAQWTPKKLSHTLRRWSQLELDDFAVFNIGKTSHGLLWRLERKI